VFTDVFIFKHESLGIEFFIRTYLYLNKLNCMNLKKIIFKYQLFDS